jgi:hypothetical protein
MSSLRKLKSLIYTECRIRLVASPLETQDALCKEARDTIFDFDTADDFIACYGLSVVIGEVLVNAHAAETSEQAAPAPAIHISPVPEARVAGFDANLVPDPADYRYSFDSRVFVSDSLSLKQVEKLRREETVRLDSALHRPLETDMKMIASASIEATLSYFSQDRSYRAKGGMQPTFIGEVLVSAHAAKASEQVDPTQNINISPVPEAGFASFDNIVQDSANLIGNCNRNASVDIPMSKLSCEELPPRVMKLDTPEAAGIYSFAAQGPEMSRAAEDFFPTPELLSVSVPAAPNISYQWSFPNIDRPIPDEYTVGVRCIITAGPNAIARIRMNIISTQHTASCSQSFQGGISCCYRPNVVGRFLDARRLPLPTRTVITF